MKCPACKGTPLKPTKIEQGLVAMGCAKCGGTLFSLLYYRDWVERNPAEEVESVEAEVEHQTNDSHATLNCPKCGRIMTKFRITSGVGNRLDLCASCDEAWLDGGEWTLLKALQLSRRIPLVFTDPWQYKVRHEANEEERRNRFVKLLGEDELLEVERIRKWISTHPKRQAILNFISHG